MEPPLELPTELSLSALRWLLGGITRARVAQLEQVGVVERVALAVIRSRRSRAS
jgi:hypothetical protein